MKHRISLTLFFIALSVSTKLIGQSKECFKQYTPYDTVTKNGNFIKYHYKYDFVSLEYGNSTFHKILDNQFPCQKADSWIPSFQWESKDFLVLRYGCGSPCSGVWILPLDSVFNARNIMFELTYDPENNLIAYLDNDNFTYLLIENLKTCQKKKIEFPFKTDHGEFIGYWIEDISLKDNKLYYKYSDPNMDSDKRKSKEVVIDLSY